MGQLFRRLVMWKRQREWELDRDMRTAWHIGAFTRGTKDLPPLEQLMVSKGKAKRRQTAREQVAMWQTIAAKFGGTFVPVTQT